MKNSPEALTKLEAKTSGEKQTCSSSDLKTKKTKNPQTFPVTTSQPPVFST